MKTSQAPALSTNRSTPHRIEPLEARIAPAIVFTPSAPVAPTVNSTDIGLGTLGGFSPIEPMVSVNDTDPGNVVVTSHRGIQVSTDGTENFSATQLFAQPPGATGLSGDTDTAFDAEGRLFWTNLVNFPGRRDVGITQVNPTTGAVIGTATTPPNTTFGDDKQMLTADTDLFGLSPYRNNLYTSFSRFGVTPGQWEVFVSRSTDQAATWSTPLQLSSFAAEGFTWPSDVAAAPDGDVFVAYHSQPDINDAELEGGTPANPNGTSGQIFVLRSTDGGVTFPQKTLAFGPGQADVTFNRQDAPGGNIAGTDWWSVGSAQPWVLVDPAREGHIYVVAADDPNNIHANGDEGNIVISRSFDDGLTWAQSTVAAPAGGSFQLFPSASIDIFGNIAVAWYDNRRGLTNGGGNFLLDVYATYSVDGGATWAPDFRINDAALDPDIGAVNRFAGPPNTTRIGEYFGLDLYGGTAYVAWNGGSPVGGAQTGQQVVFDTFSIAGSISISGDENGGPTDDIFTVRRVAGSTDLVEVFVNGDRQYSGLLSGLERLDIAGLGGNDELIIDSTNGLLNFAGGIHFDGGGGRDLLRLVQTAGAAQTSDVYSVGPDNGQGTSVITGAGGTQSVFFENIEPVIDLVPAASLVVNATPAANEISYTQGGVVANGLVAIDNFESIEFSNKTALTINAGAGSDTISLNNPATPMGLTGGITVNGGDPTGSDTLVVSGTTGIDTINFTPSSASAGTAQVNALPLITLAGIEHLAIDGQGGGDNFQVNGTASSEFIFHTPLGVQTGNVQVSALLSATYTNVGSVTPNGNGGASDTLVVNGRAGDDNFVVLSPGGNIVLTDQTTLTPLAISILEMHGLEGDDLFTLNRPNPYTRIDVDGGSGGNDRLTILGVGGVADTYLFNPSSTVGIGTVTASGVNTNYQGIDRVNIFGNSEADDTLEVRDATSDSLWDVRQGQGGDDIVQIDQREPLAYRSMGSVTLVNTGGNDLFRIVPTNLGNFSGTFTVNGFSTRDVLELDGTANNDTVTAAAAAVTFNGVTVTLGNASFASTQVLGLGGDDSANLSTFTTTPTVLRGNDGNDTLIGSPQADLIFGGDGNDILVGGAGVDQQYGEGGNDLFGNPSATANALADDTGNDLFNGGDGSDTFIWEPGDGSDTIEGGAGEMDVLNFFGGAGAEVFNVFGKLSDPSRAVLFRSTGAITMDMAGVDQINVTGNAGADAYIVGRANNGDSGNVIPPIDSTASLSDLSTTEVRVVNITEAADAADNVFVDGRSTGDNLTVTLESAATGVLRVGGLPYAVRIAGADLADRLTVRGNEGDDKIEAVSGVEAVVGVTLYGGQGDDTLSADALLLGGIGNDVLIGGLGNDSFDGGPGTDRVVASGDVNFTLTNATLTGLGTDSLTAIEEVQITGGTSANTFNVGAYTGRLFLAGDDGLDTIDFSTAPGSVIFDLDLLNFAQAVTVAGLKVTLSDAIENFTGSAFNDLLFADAAIFARTLNGGLHTVFPPGDKLSFDGRGQVVAVSPVDSNTGTIMTRTLADTAYDEFETLVITNSPSGGGFGAPGASNAFTAGEVYGLTQQLPLPGKPLAGRGPTAVAVGDVNGDTFPDMVTANSRSKFLSILLGLGDGTFGQPTNILSGGTTPTDVGLADLDGDLDLDIVVTNAGTRTVGVLLNTAGVFGAPVLTPKLKQSPTAMALGDVNGDLVPDVVVTHTSLGMVSVFLTGAGGALGAQALVKTGGKGTNDVVLGDFSGDGLLDIATSNGTTRNASLLVNAGAGVFSIAPQVFTTGIRPSALAAADFNGDGKLDLAVSHLTSRFIGILIGKATPAATFNAVLQFNTGKDHLPRSIAAGDFNGDGKIDLATGPTVGGKLRVFLGAGQGDFTQPYEFELGNVSPRFVSSVALADVNLDGQLDIITTNLLSHDVSVLLRNL